MIPMKLGHSISLWFCPYFCPFAPISHNVLPLPFNFPEIRLTFSVTTGKGGESGISEVLQMV